ncbi:pseudouridine synthase pus4 [Coemansia sp. RSA 1933]|nr:pseudouridine synthase pus4 [Coemansia sp. RSA 1933]
MGILQLSHGTLATMAAAKLAAAATASGGLFAVNKPPGISCAGLIDYVKRNAGLGDQAVPFIQHFEHERELRVSGKKIYRRRYPTALRVGHAGTLDVEAAGVLVLGVDSGCKRLDKYLKGDKSYLATGRLGIATDSMDAEGIVTNIRDASAVTSDMVLNVLPRFIGNIEQVPPMHSAIRVDGKRLYEYVRSGEPLPAELKPRKVNISDVKLLYCRTQQQGQAYGKRVVLPPECVEYFTGGRFAWDEARKGSEPVVGGHMDGFVNQPSAPTVQLLVVSGGGVYIRSLINDMGELLGCGATMATLVRMSQGPMRLGRDTIDVNDLPYVTRIVDAMRQTQARIDKDSRA